MRKLILFLALSLTLVSTASESAVPRQPTQPGSLFPMIVGGVEATKGEFPFMVSLQNASNRRHFCGGSLISPEWVLTAAHCARATTEAKLKVVIGLHKQSDTSGVEVMGVRKMIVHPDYKKETDADYDFALVQLEAPSRYRPIEINTSEISIPEIENESPHAITAGWGYLREGGPISQNLMKVEVPLVSAKRCEAAYPNDVTNRMICAGHDAGGKDSCQGDSGGPLLTLNDRDQPVLAGVVSWGHGCARAKKFGVYAKVNSVDRWISDQIN